jgi:hypothetical protein
MISSTQVRPNLLQNSRGVRAISYYRGEKFLGVETSRNVEEQIIEKGMEGASKSALQSNGT